MFAFVVRRLLIGLLIIWGVYTLTFFAVNLAPGDPFANLENPKMTKEDLERLRAKWGYDKPVLVRYFIHLGKLFWRQPDVRVFESGGLEIRLFGEDGTNRLFATVQRPPDEIVLTPTERSRIDFGAREVRVERRPDGSYPDADIASGRFSVLDTFFVVGETETALETSGVTLRASGGRLQVSPTLASAPDRVTLDGPGGETILLERTAEGLYGPVPVEPGSYRAGGVDIYVPVEQLDTAGVTIDLGSSVLTKRPVTSLLAEPLVNSLILGTAALLLDYIVGVLIGVVSATRQYSKLDHAFTLGALFVYSMPSFWLGLMLMLLFAVKLQWLPSEGMHDIGETGLLDLIEHMLLPTFVLGIGAAAATARYQRSALLEVLGQDYIRTARAKGLPEGAVVWKHAMRNALIPVITLFGLTLPFLVSGSVIVEQIFSWPGMGREVIKAIYGRDVFVVSGITLIATTMVVLGSLVADLLYALVDPRVRLQ